MTEILDTIVIRGGLEGQRSFSSATLRGVGSDAAFVIGKMLRYLKS
jgi:putative flavoprotein involved in K+ transport